MDIPSGPVDEHNPGVINHRYSLAGHLNGYPIRGPATEEVDAGRCLNAKDLRDPFDEFCKGFMLHHYGLTRIWCSACTADTEEPYEQNHNLRHTGVDTRQSIQCWRCCRTRGHFVAGFRRPTFCACHYCQHHPIPIIRHSYDLEMEMTGTC